MRGRTVVSVHTRRRVEFGKCVRAVDTKDRTTVPTADPETGAKDLEGVKEGLEGSCVTEYSETVSKTDSDSTTNRHVQRSKRFENETVSLYSVGAAIYENERRSATVYLPLHTVTSEDRQLFQ